MDLAKGNKTSPMERLAAFIVDKRNLIFLLIGIGIIFSLFSQGWVEVEDDLTAYLPSASATKEGLNVMEEQFITYGAAEIMIANISYEEAEALLGDLREMDGVQSVDFDDTTEHYSKASALFSITFDYPEADDACLDALEAVKKMLHPYDIFVSTSLGDATADLIAQEVNMITVFVAVIVVAVLTFTSQTYAEVPIILITFLVAAILNKGTSFLLGKISFVSNSVTTILQLALSLDYAVIYVNRFKEERERHELREAVIISLSKAIPEVGASSLTTIGGLIAMLFMQFRLGPDMAINLIKAIFFALLSVFLVMPGLLMLMGNLMEKTHHRNFVPKVPFIGKFAYASRVIVPPVFVLVLVFAIRYSNLCPYVYGYDTLSTPRQNEVQIAEKMISETFSSRAMVAVVVPGGDYSEEQQLIRDLERFDEIDSITAIANSEAIGGYKLADKLSPRDFAELLGLDFETSQFLYSAYAVQNEHYDKLLSGISKYNVPLIDMLLFVSENVDNGYITLEGDQAETLSEAKAKMIMGKQQLEGADYDRILVYLTLPESGDETYLFTDTIRDVAQEHYPKGKVYVVGNSTNQYEFEKSFRVDNVVVSLVSILIVLLVLLFTFKSAGMPLLLILVIQGSIWINFAYPAIMHSDVFFLTELIVSSIQMGANIDYAIVISGRFMELKDQMSKKEAIIETLNFAFPTIVTSGTMMVLAGFSIGMLSSDGAICGIGQCLGRGTIISIFLVMCVLPQILLIGEKIIDKTSFNVSMIPLVERRVGILAVDGQINGYINGRIIGEVHARVLGEVTAIVTIGNVKELEDNDVDDYEEDTDNA